MKRSLLSLLLLLSCISVLHAQDVIVLKNGSKIEGRVKTNNFLSGKLFYIGEENGITMEMFLPIKDIRYITLGEDGNDYLLEKYSIDPVTHDYKLVKLKAKSLRTAPAFRHGLYLEGGAGCYFKKTTNSFSPSITGKYLYFPKKNQEQPRHRYYAGLHFYQR